MSWSWMAYCSVYLHIFIAIMWCAKWHCRRRASLAMVPIWLQFFCAHACILLLEFSAWRNAGLDQLVKERGIQYYDFGSVGGCCAWFFQFQRYCRSIPPIRSLILYLIFYSSFSGKTDQLRLNHQFLISD